MISAALVFLQYKRRVDDLTTELQSRGYAAEALHGDMKQDQRDKVMSKFRKGQFDILIATDVAARGIDVDDVEAVFNYDLPGDDEYYVHRIGRTGRAGRAGKAYSFVVGREIKQLRDIQRFTKSVIAPMKPPTLMDVEENKMNKFMGSVKKCIEDGNLAKYSDYIVRTIEEMNSLNGDDTFISPIDFAAAMLKMATESNGSDAAKDASLIGDMDLNVDEDEDTGAESGYVRLFINVGRKDKVQPGNIIQSIASTSGLPGKLIGAINIYDAYTFVEGQRSMHARF